VASDGLARDFQRPYRDLDGVASPVQRVAGVPVSLLGAAATVATATAGWLIDRRFARDSAE
jgi:hypothetical protein